MMARRFAELDVVDAAARRDEYRIVDVREPEELHGPRKSSE